MEFYKIEIYKKTEKMSVFTILQMFYNFETTGKITVIRNYKNTKFYNIGARAVTLRKLFYLWALYIRFVFTKTMTTATTPTTTTNIATMTLTAATTIDNFNTFHLSIH